MQLTAPQYLAELNRAANVNLLDWYSSMPNTYRRSVGKLTVEVALDRTSGRWGWKLLHDRGGLLNSGDSADKDVAQHEALKYAEHWVKTAMVGLLA